LLFAEQFAGAADFEIVRREREAGAELFERGERFEALLGVGRDDAPIGSVSPSCISCAAASGARIIVRMRISSFRIAA
jgi:hypothetical protein